MNRPSTMANGWLRTYTDHFRPAMRGIAAVCDVFARAVIERLDTIADAQSPDRTIIQPLVFTAAGSKELEIPIGERWTLQLIAVSATGNVVIRSGGVLRYTQNFTAQATHGPNAMISAGPGAPLTVTTDQAMEITLQIGVREYVNPQRARSAGDQLPPGLPSNSVGTEIERHFPGTLRPEIEDMHGFEKEVRRDPSPT